MGWSSIIEDKADNVGWLRGQLVDINRYQKYCKASKTRRTLIGNKIVDHSDVVGALPFGAAPTTSPFST